MLASIGVVYTAISATDLAPSAGDESVQLGLNTFAADADTTVANSDIIISVAAASAAGDSASGIEATSALPAVNTALVSGNYAYSFEVKESGNATWQAGEDVRIRVWSLNSASTTLEATLYAQQAVTDDGAIDGVTVTVDLGSNSAILERFVVVVDRQ